MLNRRKFMPGMVNLANCPCLVRPWNLAENLLLPLAQTGIIANCVLNTHAHAPTEKYSSHPSSNKLYFSAETIRKQNVTTTGHNAENNWLWAAKHPLIRLQPLHLRLRECYRRWDGTILRVRGPSCLLLYVKEAIPKKSHHCGSLNKTRIMTTPLDKPK